MWSIKKTLYPSNRLYEKKDALDMSIVEHNTFKTAYSDKRKTQVKKKYLKMLKLDFIKINFREI